MILIHLRTYAGNIYDFSSHSAANKAGFDDFMPDSCLINEYQAGSKMSLHQDKDEADLSAPIVSISLGISATFLLGGFMR
jgi:alkylated DNA repair protein (DNA oxidative demethylase)